MTLYGPNAIPVRIMDFIQTFEDEIAFPGWKESSNVYTVYNTSSQWPVAYGKPYYPYDKSLFPLSLSSADTSTTTLEHNP